MDLVLIKDGTVPLAVAKVVARDAAGTLTTAGEELANSDGHEVAELFQVDNSTRFVSITWFDGLGFSVAGWATEREAIEDLEDGEPGSAQVYSRGHWGRVYGDEETDDVGYGHVFALS